MLFKNIFKNLQKRLALFKNLAIIRTHGSLAERLNAPVLKTGVGS